MFNLKDCKLGLIYLVLCCGLMPGCQAPVETPDSPDSSTGPQRRSVLEGQPNFRDLGGYQATAGGTVKRGIIYRSGELPHLTDEDVEKLAELRIKTVLNFLTDNEIEAQGKDRVPDGVQQIHRPIDSDVGELAQTILEARKNADFSEVPPDLNPQIHRLLVEDEKARAEYANLLRLASEPQNHPLVFHCSHGIHRTGTGAAILLWALGVPWETIRADYLLSNQYREEEIKQRLESFRQLAAKKQGVSPKEVDMTNFEAFYILQGSYIDAARDKIMEEYGGIDRFLTEGLELRQDEVDKLRQQLLD